ncbi:MAG: hypothetical protein WC831_05660 [Parcubacteria group bacterium]|jgi:hypothetical protein
MALINRPKVERLRNTFLLVFLILVVTIIFTPLIIKSGFSFLSEELFEAVLLFIQVSLAWKIFRLYERTVSMREGEIKKLETEYRKREKELLETFAYLGKINVQMSLIKSFLQKLKAPASKREMKEYVDEILRMAMTISKKDWMAIRIMNTEGLQTISEYWAKASPSVRTHDFKIGNREITELAADKKLCNDKGYCVLSSESSSTSNRRAFMIFLEKEKVDKDILGFLNAAVNQCEIIHNLFELRGNRR